MKQSRRKFVKTLAGTSFVATAMGNDWLKTEQISFLQDHQTYRLDREIRLGAIGMGIMGFNNVTTATSVEGAKLIAACDLYKGRLERTKEVFGDHIDTYQNYKDLLARNDLDAVIVSTTDHWHDHIAKDVLASGHHLYLEKPMIHHIEEGKSVIEAERKSGKKVQIGSQRVSSLVYKKARDLYREGVIGDLVLAEAAFNRQSANGAWQYSIPRDASEESIAWDLYLGDAPKVPFNPEHFFRWRNYRAYGTGVAGDLFVHLFSGMHYILNSEGPEKIYASGGLRYWDDGRDVPDVMLAMFDYPESEQHPAFNMMLKVNFIDGGGGGGEFKIIGTEGVIEIKGDRVILSQSKMSDAPGYGGWDSFTTFSANEQKHFEEWYNVQYPNPSKPVRKDSEVVFQRPEGFNAHKAHFMNWYNAIEGKEEVVEDATFGLRAAAPSLAANKSYFENKAILWDPVKMELKD
ncbi:Gfo/Idh/MocA family protein [Portibacter marinus]|uniref:Gfo/Idh/MocA family protein n=1 Tax=Portibacter marinus TaxID=2898660 RepID=UPI001F333677|nr:Gfo/Idh/MocA family oxidoreductase [Portibacter marinus]